MAVTQMLLYMYVLIDRTRMYLLIEPKIKQKVFSLQYMSNVDSWCKACGEVELPSELQDLEDAIHHHQGIYEHITLAYSEVNVLFVSLGC